MFHAWIYKLAFFISVISVISGENRFLGCVNPALPFGTTKHT
jgi:hypothetical protein